MYYTDNKFVHDSFKAGPRHQALCANADLFRILFNSTITKSIRLNVKWMPSHLLDGKKQWPSNVSLHDVKGNGYTDEYAEIASKQATVPRSVSFPIKRSYRLVRGIQLRIVTIIQNLPPRQRKQTISSQKELKPKLDDMIINSHHISVQKNQGRYCCKICSNSFHVKEKPFEDFVNSPCTYFSMSSFYHSRPEPLPNTCLHVGNQFIHHSHKLHTYKGLVYCCRCGYRKGANQDRRLAKPCSPAGTNGILNLEAIRKGELPPKL